MQTMSGSKRSLKRQGSARWLGATARSLAAFGALGAALLVASPAHACGGFFCSATNPVNQAAERIIFAKNGDGTVTAVIEIQYQGPAESFSWLLPISSVPMGDQIAVASNIAFQRLQQATNPQYNLTTRVEGECDVDNRADRSSAGPSGANGSPNLSSGDQGPSVTVEASGVVGAFEWTVISLDEALTSPAAAAVEWLEENGYDVPPGAPGLLGPYLEDGLYLLALRLKKGADAGSIRPIVLTYDADRPMIPIKLTAVAANDDMGVLTWLLGDAQAVPQNYYSLELNEARINWFSASANYNQVVTEAADDAGGQGFVTEMAGATSALAGVVWSASDEQQLQFLKEATDSTAQLANALANYQGYDGFWDVVQAHVSFAPGTTLEQFKQCPNCYSPVAGVGFLEALEAEVLEPVRLVQKLIDAHPQITRLYSTLSAEEMTVDPLFSFNPDLKPISNIHTAERIIECGPGYYQQEAPWRIELPSGGVVRGVPTTFGTWPTAFAAQPANRRVLRAGESGEGKVVEDNTSMIQSSLEDYGGSVPTPPRRTSRSSGGCGFVGNAPAGGLGLVTLGLAALLVRKRRWRAQ
jgi:hypothetical protein